MCVCLVCEVRCRIGLYARRRFVVYRVGVGVERREF